MEASALARVEKKCQQEARTPVLVDESGFYLLPSVVKSYAPLGKTPILEHTLTREHLSVMGALTPTGRLFTKVQERSLKSPDVIGFLEYLLTKIAGKLLIIWDGAPIPRSKAIQAFLSKRHQQEPGRILVERLPGYSPALNPEEGVWRYLKYEEMANICCWNLEHLRHEFVKARERLRHKKHILRACFQHADCL